ncbi:MAG: hypothetical protein HKP13_05365, partial [Gammaproteobacteria bacterium]|nr:hypothetical protein [Gammaproteobacteria bacterium]
AHWFDDIDDAIRVYYESAGIEPSTQKTKRQRKRKRLIVVQGTQNAKRRLA